MVILITGINGFIGNNLVDSFADHHQILGLDIINNPREGVLKTYLWEEISEIPHYDVLIHLAGKAHDTDNRIDIKSYFDINTELTKKIYDYFLTTDATKFIFFSSVKAIADKVLGDILTEEDSPDPKTAYGQSKYAAEKYINNNINSNKKNIYILRPCMIHGSGNKGNLNLLYSIVKQNIPWPLGLFENKRSFLSIDNLKFFLYEIIHTNIPSGVYNLSDDEPITTNELVLLISKSLNKKPMIWKIPKQIIYGIAFLGDFIKLPINRERLKKLTENYVVSNQKIKSVIGKSLPIKTKDGLIKTFNELARNY